MTATKPTLLITGGTGLLAARWARRVVDRFEVVLALHARKVELFDVVAHSEHVNLDSIAAIEAALQKHEVAVVIHTAAMTSVEACEADPAMAMHVNSRLAGNVAAACRNCGAKLVHISTDHLFAGDTPMQDEGAVVAPVNAYARTKAAGETSVREACPDVIIARTNFYGRGISYRKSFSDTILDSLRNSRRIGLFEDVFFTPILMEEAVDAVHGLIEAGACGTFNVVCDERLSKHAFGVRLARAYGLDESLIDATSLAVRSDLVKRPLDLSLCNRKLRAALGRDIGGVDAHISQLRLQDA